MAGDYVSGKKFNKLIDERDYYEHLIFQTNFSTRQLGTLTSGFQNYSYDGEGLPVPDKMPKENMNVNFDDFPPFPLKNLADFFNDADNEKKSKTTGSTGETDDKISLFVLFFIIISGLLINKNNHSAKRINIAHQKNLNVNIRNKGINRNKTMLYNNKNESRIRKDA